VTAAALPFSERVYALVRLVPRGRVVSYGGAAALLGQPRAARGVGGALSALPDDSDVPWWRVINRNGEISIKGPIHGAALQRMLLEREDIRFSPAGRVDWAEFGWAPEPAEIPPELVVGDVPEPEPDPLAGLVGRPVPRPMRPTAPRRRWLR